MSKDQETGGHILDIGLAQLTPTQSLRLLELGRTAVIGYLETGHILDCQSDDPPLDRRAGAFVTLWNHRMPAGEAQDETSAPPGLLRGCIGHIQADRPLAKVVRDVAVEAATCDRRFSPVTLEEMADITLEISVLSPLQKIDDISEIEIGSHGLVIKSGGRRGLLLPEVPKRYRWTREEFAQNLCRKIGIPTDSWRHQAELYIFSTQKLSEDHS